MISPRKGKAPNSLGTLISEIRTLRSHYDQLHELQGPESRQSEVDADTKPRKPAVAKDVDKRTQTKIQRLHSENAAQEARLQTLQSALDLEGAINACVAPLRERSAAQKVSEQSSACTKQQRAIIRQAPKDSLRDFDLTDPFTKYGGEERELPSFGVHVQPPQAENDPHFTQGNKFRPHVIEAYPGPSGGGARFQKVTDVSPELKRDARWANAENLEVTTLPDDLDVTSARPSLIIETKSKPDEAPQHSAKQLMSCASPSRQGSGACITKDFGSGTCIFEPQKSSQDVASREGSGEEMQHNIVTNQKGGAASMMTPQTPLAGGRCIEIQVEHAGNAEHESKRRVGPRASNGGEWRMNRGTLLAGRTPQTPQSVSRISSDSSRSNSVRVSNSVPGQLRGRTQLIIDGQVHFRSNSIGGVNREPAPIAAASQGSSQVVPCLQLSHAPAKAASTKDAMKEGTDGPTRQPSTMPRTPPMQPISPRKSETIPRSKSPATPHVTPQTTPRLTGIDRQMISADPQTTPRMISIDRQMSSADRQTNRTRVSAVSGGPMPSGVTTQQNLTTNREQSTDVQRRVTAELTPRTPLVPPRTAVGNGSVQGPQSGVIRTSSMCNSPRRTGSWMPPTVRGDQGPGADGLTPRSPLVTPRLVSGGYPTQGAGSRQNHCQSFEPPVAVTLQEQNLPDPSQHTTPRLTPRTPVTTPRSFGGYAACPATGKTAVVERQMVAQGQPVVTAKPAKSGGTEGIQRSFTPSASTKEQVVQRISSWAPPQVQPSQMNVGSTITPRQPTPVTPRQQTPSFHAIRPASGQVAMSQAVQPGMPGPMPVSQGGHPVALAPPQILQHPSQMMSPWALPQTAPPSHAFNMFSQCRRGQSPGSPRFGTTCSNAQAEGPVYAEGYLATIPLEDRLSFPDASCENLSEIIKDPDHDRVKAMQLATEQATLREEHAQARMR